MVDICTNKDMVVGGYDLGILKCHICCKETHQKAGYIGDYCYECKHIITGDEWAGDIARRRRELLKMTKRQIGTKLGLSNHTIHGYEWKKCPKSYLDKLETLLRESVKTRVSE